MLVIRDKQRGTPTEFESAAAALCLLLFPPLLAPDTAERIRMSAIAPASRSSQFGAGHVVPRRSASIAPKGQRLWSSSGYDSDDHDLHAFPSRDVGQDLHDYIDSSSGPHLRYSGSSSATHILETPPRTPNRSDPIEVVVAPVSGVETMDALVDGINGFHSEDLFASASIHRHELKSKRRSGHPQHRQTPIPPLPKLPAIASPVAPQKHKRQGSKIPRPVTSTLPRAIYSPDRTASQGGYSVENTSIGVLPQHADANTSTKSTTFPGTISIQPRKVAIPSISEIIRNHATVYDPRTRSTLSNTEHETEDFISRSSIDSVAEEVQQTLRKSLPDSPARPSDSPWFTKPVTPLQESSVSLDRGSSVRSSATSSPSDPYSFQPGPLSEREAIATYLRSTRLTTLIKLPRPHQPSLQVSFSDLGDPNGRPVVVFLGLGSVRYLMGLYDEMAEILGLRLITIDR